MSNNNKSVLILADVTGMGPDYHVGDEAMAEVAITRLAKIFGRENLVLACSTPANASLTYGVKAIPLYSLTKKQRLINLFKRPLSSIYQLSLLLYYIWRCDLVFISGGGNHTSVWPHVLESRLFFLRLVRLFKRRVIFASQTLGPFTDEHRAVCQEAFSTADWVGVRDRGYSAKQLDITVHFAVDDAVFLPAKHDNQTRAISAKKQDMIGLSLRGFKGVTDEHREKLCLALASITVNKNATTVFIPHHAAGGMGDLDIARKITPLWPEKSPLLVLDPIPHASAVKALTGDCSLNLTMRYHQLIFSLSVGVPSIGIYAEEYTKAKLNGAFEQFGLTPLLLPLEEAPRKIGALIDEALRSKDVFYKAAKKTLESSLNQNMEPYRKAAELCSRDQAL